MELAEPEIDEGARGLGGQATSPIGGNQSEAERALSWNGTRFSKMGIDAAVPDVAAVRLEDGGPEAQAVRGGPQEPLPKPVLGLLARPGSSAHEPAHRGIGLQRAEGAEILQGVVPEEEPFGFEDDYVPPCKLKRF